MLAVANDSVSGENCCPNSDSSEGKQEPATVSGTKKKPTMLKSVELSNFVIDNDIRAAAGFKKISFKQSRLLSPPTASVKKENLARKGIRRQKSPTPMKKVGKEVF
ncbi:hypothetical protein NECAME_10847 [Necator americanus]|uniref:Uncharacterized protein n=1 Tax=Necator americanus TaxID=51031 RepID=W2T6Y5_NECAM|nr:hypothetical protein NECAME_10847 [Necator americanus]ETN77755.1 hypothetical protein NECAME_10847 [Necator americanus]